MTAGSSRSDASVASDCARATRRPAVPGPRGRRHGNPSQTNDIRRHSRNQSTIVACLGAISCARIGCVAIYCLTYGGGAIDRLDDTDERILAELGEHARATFAEIGQKVNLSAPAVKRRVDRMLDNGVIKGFTTVVERNALGWSTEAYVQVFCHGTIAPDELRAAWADIPEVVSAATVTGTSDAILHVLARDMQHLETALERIRSTADVERSESIVVLSNLIDRTRP